MRIKTNHDIIVFKEAFHMNAQTKRGRTSYCCVATLLLIYLGLVDNAL
jgi:hypothetical protein